MVTMNSVWDRTTEVLAGRGGILAAIAVPTILLPTIVRGGYAAYATPASPGSMAVGAVLALVAALLSTWGQLSLIAVASDPATDRGAAFRIGASRLLPALGVGIVVGVVLAISFLPAVALLLASGVDFTAMAAGRTIVPGSIGGGPLAGALLYTVAWTFVLAWIAARLVVWQQALVNERNGLRSLARSWALTRGSTGRIIGVLLLFIVVLLVVASAAQFVSGTVFRLILGANGIATAVFLAGIVAAVVSTLFAVLAVVFLTRLYVALAEAKPAA